MKAIALDPDFKLPYQGVVLGACRRDLEKRLEERICRIS